MASTPPSDPAPGADPGPRDDAGRLQDLFDSGCRLSVSQALLIGLEAARALMRLHRGGSAHGGVEAANLIFDTEDRVRLADPDPAPPQPDDQPEAAADPADPRDDIRDLGLMISQAVVGPEASADDEALGPLQEVVARAVSPRPEDRPSAADLVRDLIRAAEVLPRPEPFLLIESALSDSPPDGGSLPDAFDPAPVMAPPAPRPAVPLDDAPKRRWPGILLAVAVVAAAGYGAVFAWQSTVTELDAVPDLVGRHRADAIAEATALGWMPEVVQVRQPGTDPEEVVRTEPEAGAELPPGRSLRLFVSLGEPLVPVPDVAGLSPEQAEAALASSGFVVSGEVPVPDAVHPPGTVVGADLRSWVTELEPGAEIGLLVSTGPTAPAG